MKEIQIIDHLLKYLSGKGYVFTTNVGAIDVVAIKGDETFIIEAKGDQVNTGRAIYIVIGQIISRMNIRTTVNRKYGIAVSPEHLEPFRYWGVEGLKLLPIHLFLVDESGKVEHKTPEEFVKLIASFSEEEYHGLRLT